MKEVSIGIAEERRAMAMHLRLLADALETSNDIPVVWDSIRETALAIASWGLTRSRSRVVWDSIRETSLAICRFIDEKKDKSENT